jgi:hypothetical protein
MAINRDPAEWFERFDRMDEVVYGILKATNEWVVLKKEGMYTAPEVSEVARVGSRQAAIGFIKLLVEQ